MIDKILRVCIIVCALYYLCLAIRSCVGAR